MPKSICWYNTVRKRTRECASARSVQRRLLQRQRQSHWVVTPITSSEIDIHNESVRDTPENLKLWWGNRLLRRGRPIALSEVPKRPAIFVGLSKPTELFY